MKYTHAYKFDTEWNNITKIKKLLKEPNEPYKYEIYSRLQVYYWMEYNQNNKIAE
jgi:hypothetical protein